MKKTLSPVFAFVLALAVVLGLASCGKDVEFNVGFVVDGEIYQTVGTSGNEAISMPQNPTKEGYTFDGWYWDEGVWKKPFTANSLLDTPLSSDMNVYAKWTEINAEPETPSTNISSSALNISGEIVTATFSNEITTFSFLNDIKVADGASYILANDIGCQNTIASKTVSLSEGDNIYYLLVTNEDAQKLYTVTIRRRPIYTVEFNTNGGTNIETQYVEEGSVVEEADDAYKTGYIFDGWRLNNEAAVFPYTVICNTTFDAEYTIVTYDIEYHLNGGENSSNNVTNYTIEQEIILNNPTRAGYAFFGWFTEDTFENKVEKINLGSNGNKEFYAKWQACKNKIVFIGNDATSGSMVDTIIDTDETSTLLNNAFVKKGYTFKGWSTTAGGDVVYADGASYTMGTNSTYTLYAVWEANYNTLTFDSNGGSGDMQNMTIVTDAKQVLTSNSFTRLGYTFKGWSTTAGGNVVYADGANYTMGTDSTYTLYAVWEANNNTLTFDSNGGGGNMPDMTIATDSRKYLSLNTFVKKGYTFKGWSTTAGGNVEYVDGANYTMGTGSAYTLYAVWEANNNTLIFDSNGGSGNMQNMTIVTDAKQVLTSNSFARLGYTFKGWSTTAGGNVDYADGANYTMGTNSTYTLYAVWEANNNTLIFDSNGGSGNMQNMTIVTDAKQVLTSNSFTRLGYTFKGWSTTAGGNVDYADGANYTMGTNSTYTLYAVWEITKYSITYETNGGTHGNPVIFTIEDLPLSLSTPTHNRDFLGWYADADCTEKVEQINSLEDTVLFAKWGSFAYKEYSTYVSLIGFDGKETEITIPSMFNGKPVTRIEKNAFRNCYNLISVEMPNCIIDIGEYAFDSCTSLAKINIPTSMSTINKSTFKDCVNLTSITIPENITSIKQYAFLGCYKLMEIYNLSDLEITVGYNSTTGLNAEIVHTSSDAKSILETVDNYIFMTLQGKYYLMGYAANDSALVLPNNYHGNTYSIHDNAFSGRYNIISVVIAEGVTYIGREAFGDCTNLASIFISSSVINISTYDAFSNCINLTSITVDEDNRYYKSLDGNLYSKDGKTLVRYTAGKTDTLFTVPEGVTTIERYAFSYCNALTCVAILNDVININANAFWYCTNLTSIIIPESVTTMGHMVFTRCDKLTIYCEVEAQPSGWHSDWNYSNCPVEWGCVLTSN